MAKIHTNISHFFSSSNEQRKYNKKVFFCLLYNPTPFWPPPLINQKNAATPHNMGQLPWPVIYSKWWRNNFFNTTHSVYMFLYDISFITRIHYSKLTHYSPSVLTLNHSSSKLTHYSPSSIKNWDSLHSIIMSTHSVFIWPCVRKQISP